MKAVDPKPLRLLWPELPSPEAMLPWLRRMEAAGIYTNFGPLSRELECLLADRWGTDRPVVATTTANGTTALTLALIAMGLPAGSFVLVPALTFPGTAAAVVAAGLRPILGAVDEGTWLLDPGLAEKAARQGVAAAVPVAVFGRPVPTDAWDSLTEKTGMRVVVDAAGAIGDQRVGQTTGVVVSLHATKPLPAGEGGVFAAVDKTWVGRVRELSNFGFASGLAVAAAGNAKLSEYHAAVALAGCAEWPRRAWKLRRLAGWYARRLARSHRVSLPSGHRPWVRTTIVVRLPGRVTEELIASLDHLGVPTRQWYFPPLPAHPAYSQCETMGDVAATARLASTLLGLPCHTRLQRADVDRVVAALESRLP